MTTLEKKGEPFPSNFDFNFYLKGIQISLEKIDHNVSTSKVLWHIYKTIHYMPIENRIAIINELLRKHFYRFFFHWSYNIREIFYLIIFYQIEY